MSAPGVSGVVVSPIYQPALRNITAITLTSPAAVTTFEDHNFFDSDLVRLIIPLGFGMVQADGLFGSITVTGTKTFTIAIDTIAFDTFSDPGNNQFAQCVPIASKGDFFLDGATHNTLPSRNR